MLVQKQLDTSFPRVDLAGLALRGRRRRHIRLLGDIYGNPIGKQQLR